MSKILKIGRCWNEMKNGVNLIQSRESRDKVALYSLKMQEKYRGEISESLIVTIES